MRLETDKALIWLCMLAAVAYLPALGFYYVGEEAIFPITSLEMHHSGSWLVQTLYGANVRHNPLFNWLIILLSDGFGWRHVLAVTRAIAMLSTIGCGVVLFSLARHLSGSRAFSLFSTLIYLSFADVALYHGWLAYVDPLFSLFVFASIALLWVSARQSSTRLLFFALILIELAFLTKAMTAYVFYGVSALVLLRRHRAFLLGAPSLILHVLAFAFPLIWFAFLPSHGQGGRMFEEILSKLALPGFSAYLRQLFGFPLEALLRMAPATLLVLYFVLRKKAVMRLSDASSTAFWIGFFNLLPYWLSPHSSIRYILPIYPFFSLCFAGLLWKEGCLKASLNWMGGVVGLKLAFFLFLFPWYQSHYRGENYLNAAREIAKETEGFPLYATDVSSSGLSVTGYLDALRLPGPPLVFPPAKWENGFALAYVENPEIGKTYRVFKLGGDEIYLLCRGKACAHARRGQ
jgi:hypothetical protein